MVHSLLFPLRMMLRGEGTSLLKVIEYICNIPYKAWDKSLPASACLHKENSTQHLCMLLKLSHTFRGVPKWPKFLIVARITSGFCKGHFQSENKRQLEALFPVGSSSKVIFHIRLMAKQRR